MRSKYCLEKKVIKRITARLHVFLRRLRKKFYDWAALGDQSVTKQISAIAR